MDQESASAQPAAAPVVEPQPAAVPLTPVPVTHGNAAVARMATTPGAPLSPGTVQAIAPHSGNAAIARMIVAREPAPAAPPTQAATPKAPTPPKLALPGNQGLSIPAVNESVQTGVGQTVKSKKENFGVPIQLGPVFGEVGGTLQGQAAYKGNVGLKWTRSGTAVTDPLAATDTIAPVSGSGLTANGSVAGGLYAKLGLGTKVLNAAIRAEGTVKAEANGSFSLGGSVTRQPNATNWGGALTWEINASGTLTANAAAYFEWHVFWFGGSQELFKLRSFPLAALTVSLGGTLTPDGKVSVGKSSFSLSRKTAPKPQGTPVGGAPGGAPQVARRPLDAALPPADPRTGGNVLARAPDEQAADGAQPAAAPDVPAAAAPAPAPDPAAPAPAAGSQSRSPEEIAGGPGGGEMTSQIVPSEEPEGVDP